MRRPLFVVLLAGLVLLLTACPAPGGKTPVPEAPPAPSGLTATAENGTVILNWSAASGDGIASYNIYQGTTSDDLTKVGSVTADTLTYRATSLTNGTEYFFAVDAETTGGKLSAKSNEASATPTADAIAVAFTPVHGTADVGINSNINVTFSEAMDETVTEAAFSIEPALTCPVTWNADSTRLTCAPASGLTPNTSYTVTVGVNAEAQTGTRLAAARSATFTTGSTVAAECVFGTSQFDACVFAP